MTVSISIIVGSIIVAIVIWAALLVQRYLSNAASFVSGVVYSVKDHQTFAKLNKAGVRQVVPDKRFPLTQAPHYMQYNIILDHSIIQYYILVYTI